MEIAESMNTLRIPGNYTILEKILSSTSQSLTKIYIFSEGFFFFNTVNLDQHFLSLLLVVMIIKSDKLIPTNK
jgi:hypothetical protein